MINLGSFLDIILYRPRAMHTAPRDGTAILAFVRYPPNYFEWREVHWHPFDAVWRAGEQTFTENQLESWLPAPAHPIPASGQA
jgi:hypothetical protein